MLVGGSAVPRAMIAGFQERHGLRIVPRLGHDGDLAGRLGRDAARRACRAPITTRSSTTRAKQGLPAAVRRDPRARRRRRAVAVGRRDDGRARGARPVGRGALLRRRRSTADRFDRRRLVPDRRHRHDRPARATCRSRTARRTSSSPAASGSAPSTLENALMAHPAVAEAAVIAVPHDEVAGAAAGRRRAEAGRDGDAGAAARVPRAALREMVAARRFDSSRRSRRRPSASSRRRRSASSSHNSRRRRRRP